jgi:hypothetical protein
MMVHVTTASHCYNYSYCAGGSKSNDSSMAKRDIPVKRTRCDTHKNAVTEPTRHDNTQNKKDVAVNIMHRRCQSARATRRRLQCRRSEGYMKGSKEYIPLRRGNVQTEA